MQQFEYKAEMKQLLKLIVHSLYTHRDVFLRELISNASDALNKVRFRKLTDSDIQSADAPLQITITLDDEGKALTLEDTGIGMTRNDLIERIGTVASSGTLAFIEAAAEQAKQMDGRMIGQFGVGFYAAFMVADEVTIDTRHADPGAEAWQWSSDGSGTYTVGEGTRETRGTTITLKLKEDAAEFAKDWRVKDVVRKYSNFVDFPILVAGEQVNTVKALWRKSTDNVTEDEYKEFYQFISGDFQEPLDRLHLHLEGAVTFDALLFIPKTAPPNLFQEDYQRKLHLYANNVFIQDDAKDLLPEYLRFVRGVVDTDQLPLNVSREVTQNSPVMAKIQKILTKRVLNLLGDWAKNDAETYAEFFNEFGVLLKYGVSEDYAQRDRLLKLLRYASTTTEGDAMTSLEEYVNRMKDGQDAIYYVLGEHRDQVIKNPNLEYFRQHGIEVLLLTDPIDVFTVNAIGTYEEKELTSIDKADLDLGETPEQTEGKLDDSTADALLLRFKDVLGEAVEDVVASKRLVDSPATLVVGSSGLDAQTERLMKMMNQDLGPTKRILEVNMAHPLIKNVAGLREQPESAALVESVINQVYAGALLLEGNLDDPTAFVERMTALMEKATA
ncbi:MAG: molecular chaperone HtpG [Bacteroidota bacterium]